jgi:hypothetical protein
MLHPEAAAADTGTPEARFTAAMSAALTTDRMPLTAADRCDRCGARAYVRVTLLSGGELYFCAHHAREHEAALRAVAADLEDATDDLAEVPPIAPLDER